MRLSKLLLPLLLLLKGHCPVLPLMAACILYKAVLLLLLLLLSGPYRHYCLFQRRYSSLARDPPASWQGKNAAWALQLEVRYHIFDTLLFLYVCILSLYGVCHPVCMVHRKCNLCYNCWEAVLLLVSTFLLKGVSRLWSPFTHVCEQFAKNAHAAAAATRGLWPSQLF
jgi:hypothetical protein